MLVPGVLPPGVALQRGPGRVTEAESHGHSLGIGALPRRGARMSPGCEAIWRGMDAGASTEARLPHLRI